MLGWLNAEIARASRSRRCFASGLLERCSGRILMATVRSRRVSRARYTSPIPPAPSGETISYGPSLAPSVSATVAKLYLPKQNPADISCLQTQTDLKSSDELARSPEESSVLDPLRILGPGV